MPKLKKKLTLIDVFSIAAGAMISSGLFVLPGLAYAQAGPAIIVSYFIAGVFALTGMLSQAELVSAMPKAGGTYFYVTRSLGPAVGTIDGLITWFSLSLKSVFALFGMAAFIKLIVAANMHIVAFILCAIFLIINIVGIKEAGRIQVVLVFSLLAVLAFYIVRGIPAVKAVNFEPFASGGWRAVFSTAGFVFISYGGLLKVASIAEETKNPAYTVPLAMMLSMFFVGIIYFFVVFVTTGVLGDKLALSAVSLTPISDSAQVFMGQAGRIVMGVAAMLAFMSTANAGIMAASRYPLALSRDGLLPDFLTRINKKYNTPHNAILFTGLLMIVALLARLKVLIEAASTVLILTYMFSCFSVIIMRESRIQNYKPRFHTPVYPLVQIVGILGSGFLLLEMGYEALFISISLIIGGFLVYWFYGRIRSNSEYALLHIIERITAKEFTANLLESELKDIIRERDDITKDRFDRIIEQATVLDIKNQLSLDELLNRIAELASAKLNISHKEIFNLLRQREKESNTGISKTLAIPHIVINGEHIFDIFLVRAAKGVFFSPEASDVHVVFVLMGTIDERNFHLRSLAAIAQIAQVRNFDSMWMKARNKNELKDIVLLAQRKRQQ